MSIFGNDPEDFVPVSHIPPLVQENGGKIDPRAQEYIYGGEVREFDEYLRTALKKYVRRDREKNIAAAALLLLFGALPISEAILGRGKISVFVFIISSVFILLTVWFICREVSNSIALKEADKGNIRCYRYKFYNKLGYEYDTEGCGSYHYYADLGDFAVTVSRDTKYAPYVFGAVISIKGTEHFYLLDKA